jgi:hypothetical protein
MAAKLERVSQGLRTVFAVALLTVATWAVAQELNPSHPDTYVVKRGDTLWDIAGRFLQRPWLWPEIWQANPQIANPHLIYPGDVISLAYLDRVVIEPGPREEAPIDGIPLEQVAPFLKNLSVVDSYEQLPYVVGLEGDRLRSSDGQLAYLAGVPGAQPGQRYAVVRPTQRFTRLDRTACCDLFHKDDLDFRGRTVLDTEDFWTDVVTPDNGSELLGYEMMQVATGTITRGAVGGIEAATLLLDEHGKEVRIGDRIVPVEPQPYDLRFFPHAPAQQFEYGRARVLAVADTEDFWTDVIVPDQGSELLGYEMMQVATGTVTRGAVGGIEAVTLLLDHDGKEVRIGDRIVPVEPQPYDLRFFPHAPAQQLEYGRARVLAVADMLTTGGTHDVVALSVGARDGVDNGTVFSAWRVGRNAVDKVEYGLGRTEDTVPGAGRVRLPDEFASHVMVFRTFDRMSYALVMESTKPTRVGYELKHPDAPY